jgi:hypothetical protein
LESIVRVNENATLLADANLTGDANPYVIRVRCGRRSLCNTSIVPSVSNLDIIMQQGDEF